MANRRYNNQQFTMAPGVVGLWLRATIGAAGAPTLDVAQSKGIVSITRNSAGNYTIVFGTKVGMLDVYNKLLHCKHVFDTSGTAAAPASPGMYISNNSVSNPALCSLTVIFNAAGVATDPASGEIVHLAFDLKNSSAP